MAMDSVLGTVDLISTSDWVTIWPAITAPFSRLPERLKINPLVDPCIDSNLVLIEPARRPLSRHGEVFLEELRVATASISEPWRLIREGADLDDPTLVKSEPTS
jgi:hypothetical protein